jgi:hypothetical protein
VFWWPAAIVLLPVIGFCAQPWIPDLAPQLEAGSIHDV